MPRAVIFDVDGVLVDSYAAHLKSWVSLAREQGVAFTGEQFASTFGRTSRDIIRESWGGRHASEDQTALLDDRKEALFREILAAEFPAMAGAIELIDTLEAHGWRLAVGSSGPPENVSLVLDALGRRTSFAAAVTGRDVTRGKPDPQVFQIAARRLDVHPGRCVVVEDAPAGTPAAKRAGMRCIGLASTGRMPAELAEADLVVQSLAELLPEGEPHGFFAAI